MNIKLLAHTQLSEEFVGSLPEDIVYNYIDNGKVKDGQVVALSAIRTCYSPNKPSEIMQLEGKKYFGNKATDGEEGTEADRLFRHITGSGHTSTLEHINYTFAIEGVSRALMAQLTRHRHLSFSIQSQRYVRLGSEDKSGGFEYVSPKTVKNAPKTTGYFDDDTSAYAIYNEAMHQLQIAYDGLRACGVPAEDARMVLPNAATTNIVLTGNLRTLLEFYKKRQPGKGAQWEVADLADGIKNKIVSVDPWLKKYFE